jgi:tetratricopeptide (TPR) repeat protein
LAKGSIEAMDNHHGRRKIWNANIDAFRDGGLLGAGVGAHSSIYPVYLPQSLRGEYTHAESGYLQVATENGVIGVMLLASAMGLCGAWCVTSLRYGRSDQERLWIGAVAGGLAASAVHSIVDFVWYIPACICVTIVLAACALRLAQLVKRDSAGATLAGRPGRVPSLAYRLATPLVGALSVWAIWTYVGPARASIHWDRYLRVDVASRDLTRDSLARFVENEQQSASAAGDRAAILDAMLRHLRCVVECDPHFAPARFKLALHLANEFERRQQSSVNAMAIDQISDAAMSSQFKSPAEVSDWLQRAFGDDSRLLAEALLQVRAGLACSPFEGQGYQLLAKLCFLEGQSRAHAAAYIAQGLRVRPYDGALLFAVGRVSLLNGDLVTAMQYWRKCFRDAGAHQLKIVSLMAGEIPASIFVEAFEPDWRTLPQIWTRYRDLNKPQDLVDLVAYSARVTDRGVPPESNLSLDAIWLGQATMYRDLKRTAEQLACLQEAYRANPHGFEVRYQLAHALLESHRYAEAEPHFRWCLARRPEQKELGIALAQITERRRAERDPGYQSQSGIARAWEN